jgi:hypothetical protein
MLRRSLVHWAFCATLGAAAAVGCSASTGDGGATTPAPAPPATQEPQAPASIGATPLLKDGIDPQIVSKLKTAGFTVDTLPAQIKGLSSSKRHAIMETFTIALGTTCDGCHQKGAATEADFAIDTPRKKIARRMWTDFVAALQKKDGSAIYCDTCHQGKIQFLDRSDVPALRRWMQKSFVDGLARKDGSMQECARCHGEPFNDSFLDDWKK